MEFKIDETFGKDLENQLFNDESIISFSDLGKRNGLSNRKICILRKYFYDKFGKETVLKITVGRQIKMLADKKRGTKLRPRTEEEKRKISEINKKIWSERPDLIEISRNNGKASAGRKLTNETIDKRRESRKGYKHSEETIKKITKGRLGKPLPEWWKEKLRVPKKTKRENYSPSKQTREKLSVITKKQWVDGIHKNVYKSKKQIELKELLKSIGYVVKDEYVIDGRPYDFYIESLNLIIEFNGTFWHRDPRFYEDFNLRGQSIWERDRLKMETAKNKGFKTLIIWQYDWETTEDREQFIKEKIYESTTNTRE